MNYSVYSRTNCDYAVKYRISNHSATNLQLCSLSADQSFGSTEKYIKKSIEIQPVGSKYGSVDSKQNSNLVDGSDVQ